MCMRVLHGKPQNEIEDTKRIGIFHGVLLARIWKRKKDHLFCHHLKSQNDKTQLPLSKYCGYKILHYYHRNVQQKL